MTALDVEAVRGYLVARGVAVAGALEATLIAGGRSNLTYLVTDGVSRWVLRRPPTAGLTPSAHDMAREFQVTRGLRDTSVPVPATVALCEDESVIGAPFAVVAHVDGAVVRSADDLARLSDDRIDDLCRALVRTLVDLHRTDYDACGLGSFGRPEGFAGRQVRLWARQWERVAAAPSADITALAGWLSEHVAAQSDSSIVHGDFRVDNVMVDDAVAIAAVLDWELSTLGDPLTDVALMCAYRHPAMDLILGFPTAWTSDRLPDADDLAQRYAVYTGGALPHWDFHRGLAQLKIAVIAAGIDHRYRSGAAAGEGFDRAGEAVAEFAAAGLRAVAAGRAA